MDKPIENDKIAEEVEKKLEEIENKKIAEKSKIKLKDFFKVSLTTISILLLNYDPDSKNNNKEEDPNNTYSFSYYFIIGYLLLIASIIFDGILALKEKLINAKFEQKEDGEHINNSKNDIHYDYMYLFNIISLVLSFIGLVVSFNLTNFANEYKAFITNKEFMFYLIVGCIFSSTGQVFIYKFMIEYGPLALSIVTGIRKIISIGASIFFFDKKIDEIRIFSLIVGFGVICWELFDKSKEHKKSVKEKLE
jgi:drug/metabolite transporter (DMT)-like permease